MKKLILAVLAALLIFGGLGREGVYVAILGGAFSYLTLLFTFSFFCNKETYRLKVLSG